MDYSKKINYSKKLEKICIKIFFVASLVSLVSLFTISIFLFINGAPAISEIGLVNFIFGTNWDPTGSTPSFGILYMILTSIIATLISLIISTTLSIFIATYLVFYSNKRTKTILENVVTLLAGIPSVIYGFMGLTVLVPFVMNVFNLSSGANMFSAILVLSLMALPTIVSIIKTSLENIDSSYYRASLALGATHTESVFKVMIPAAKSGILTAVVLGASRVIGETMAVIMVSGNVVNFPSIFNPVRFLTSGIQFEMNYSAGLHREALFAIGLVLFIFILLLNLGLARIIRKKQ